ncbi:HAD family hydrolase [Myxosarcina sp. GI1]|uniref:HAD family hydrolase n=1 Tax=Myxosarcina sp. GI1 TaxID=1541065 RepID=UPI00055E35F1|nr:HAD family phosphatase [Myxosarcina sp. GI1]
MIKAVIFDLDGTLVNSVDYHAQAWVEAFKKHGYDFSFEKLRQQIGKGSEFIIGELLSESEYEKYYDDISNYRKQYYQENLLEKVQPFPKVRELFEKIEQDGKEIVLASSARKETIEHYKQLLNIEDLIKHATSTDDVEKSKPEPDIFNAALDKLTGMDKEEVIVVGDSPYDAIAASKIPLYTIGVLCGGFDEKELREAGCSEIFKDPADMLANYSKLPF